MIKLIKEFTSVKLFDSITLLVAFKNLNKFNRKTNNPKHIYISNQHKS